MIMTSQNEVTERMEALVNVLKAASSGNEDNALLEKACMDCKKKLSSTTITTLPQEAQEWDDDIINLTKQLQKCIEETPEKLPLEQEQKARVTYKPTTSHRSSKHHRPEKKKSKQQPQQPQPDRRQELQREESEMSYPKIGPGYSDTISVVSDLSIPTVVTNLHVDEEEYYRDLPPINNNVGAAAVSQTTKRQPSIGSKIMTTPRRRPDDEEEETLMAPSLVAAPSIAAPSLVVASPSIDELRAPSRRIVQYAPPPPLKRPGGAAAQRRQTHQAVLAHLQHQTTATAATSAASGGGRGNVATSRRASTGIPNQRLSKPLQTKMTVNDLPPLNFPKDEPSEYGMRNTKAVGGKRRSLLSRGNKYAASVTATSTRMLLSQKQKQNKRNSLLKPKSKQEETTPTSSQVDLDGVLSTMNCDIDFIFNELSVYEDAAATSSTPAAAASSKPTKDSSFPDESNIGATAKIKYTLGSVARTLRDDDDDNDEMNWEPLNDKETNNSASVKADPVLIDEDGFIVSSSNNNNSSDAFGESFGGAPNSEDPFANSFFPQAQKEITKKKQKKRSPSGGKKMTGSPLSPDISIGTKESRIDAVEQATKKRIEMLRRLVEYRARHHVSSQDSSRSERDSEELEKLDFVEAETMKQIARLRDRLGASRRELGQA